MPSIKQRAANPFNGVNPAVSLDDVCNLITITTTKDELGQAIEIESLFMVFCSRLDITRAEHSAAGQLGHKPKFMLLVDVDAYDNQRFLEYQEKKYSIYKTFQRWEGYIELYCELKTGDKNR